MRLTFPQLFPLVFFIMSNNLLKNLVLSENVMTK